MARKVVLLVLGLASACEQGTTSTSPRDVQYTRDAETSKARARLVRVCFHQAAAIDNEAQLSAEAKRKYMRRASRHWRRAASALGDHDPGEVCSSLTP